ncbi:MAG: pyrroline-5-carboxylate reductase [Thermoleophilaceae bacterium]
MQIGFIGAGSMATALARGISEPALVFAPNTERAQALADAIGGEVASSNAELAERCDVVVLAHKPAQVEEVADQMDGAADALASIVAATPLDRLETAYPGVPVYRLIPNIPVEVGRGVFGYAPGSHAADGPQEELLHLLGRCGVVVQLDEPLLEPAMALMSCGPAFLAVVVEALAQAGAAHGLDPRQATRLVVETMAGSAAYLDANDLDAGELRRRVATPGGLTERGLGVLEEKGLPEALHAAVNLVVESSR